ncbi:hypothetical protein FB45DRAFT_1028452 [Roridomyces roridus]|uniref:Uncharacterized protein n=1 Tax=Roridomyces roridus TaxID=1738132 RepID=A0AAD7FMG6_9AGAR|nr:hypothetical protein FB45DRAFT_1028452 [Roridomyces roridus]
MLPPELFELIVRLGWDCLSTTNYRHSYAMTQWMLVSHEWLRIVVPIVSRNVWIISIPHDMHYICGITNMTESCIYQLAGISNVREYFQEICRSVTIVVYQGIQAEYLAQCAELEEYARNPECTLLIKDSLPVTQRLPMFPLGPRFVASFIRDYTPNIKSLHFILVDCTPVYHHWAMSMVTPYLRTDQYPETLTDLGISFAYTSPPPALLRDAPRGTFFPPRSPGDIPPLHNFAGIKCLVVRMYMQILSRAPYWSASSRRRSFARRICRPRYLTNGGKSSSSDALYPPRLGICQCSLLLLLLCRLH